MRPSIYRAAALELMERLQLDVQSVEMAAQILSEFDRDLQRRISVRRQPDGTWRMELHPENEQARAV